MKKDLLIAVLVIALVLLFSFGVARLRADLPLTASKPFSTGTGPAPAGNEKIVMRVNGEPVTESEFKAFLQNVVPAQMQAMYASPEGRFQLSEQLIRLKVLEQEAKKRGLDNDPAVQGQLAAVKAQITAMAALRELGKNTDDKALRAEYEKNKAQFETLQLRHIVVAYQGGQIPPRNGQALSQQQAAAKAQQIAQLIRGGADFAKTAQQVSDDPSTGPNGGALPDIPRAELPPEVGTMLASLKPGEVSGPVPTQMGVHIFKLEGRKVLPFEQVKEQLAQKGQQDAAQKEWEKLAKEAKVERDPKFFAVPMQGGNRQPS